jgi:hypothetical protein
MVNKRMLAVAAVLVLAVPALGAAATVYVAGPQPEQLVEGHTVFTVIQVAVNTTTVQAKFAAAVAVLVRENLNANSNFRFPGVLWFNDQYLVNPSSPTAATASYRYPCGGAVMAVNKGDPDPRLILANINDGSSPITGAQQGSSQHDYLTGVGYGSDHSVVGVNPTGPTVYSDAGLSILTNTGGDYKESYYITDPNDHGWTIDKYTGYTRMGVGGQSKVYNFPVWVVNLMGGPAFIPDDGKTDCQPYVDTLLNTINPPPAVRSAIQDTPENLTHNYACAQGGSRQAPFVGGVSYPLDMPARDQPCAGYAEPAGNSPSGAGTPGNNGSGGYCYDGNTHQVGSDCKNKALYPTRIYNALLYFHLEDLRTPGTPITHDGANGDTNGCQTGTEWACPNNDDNAEGNSHPFNPYGNSATAPSNAAYTASPCPPAYENADPAADTNTVNHGGSAAQDAGNAPYCDHTHATRQIDIYFDAAGRPLAPLNRNFETTDTTGSSAPFAGTGSGAAPPRSPSTFP